MRKHDAWLRWPVAATVAVAALGCVVLPAQEDSRIIQEGERKAGSNDFWGYVWQGRAYEGLTTNALEWIASNNGGTIIDDKGEITIDNPDAAEALKTAAGWVGTTPAPTARSAALSWPRAA